MLSYPRTLPLCLACLPTARGQQLGGYESPRGDNHSSFHIFSLPAIQPNTPHFSTKFCELY